MTPETRPAVSEVVERLRARLEGYRQRRFPGPFEIRPWLVREAADYLVSLTEALERIAGHESKYGDTRCQDIARSVLEGNK